MHSEGGQHLTAGSCEGGQAQVWEHNCAVPAQQPQRAQHAAALLQAASNAYLAATNAQMGWSAFVRAPSPGGETLGSGR